MTCADPAGIRLGNYAIDAISSSKQPAAWFSHETVEAYLASHAPTASEPHPTPDALKDAFSKTVRKMAGAGNSDFAALKRIRAEYANEFHPDRLPESLKELANRQLAEINARIDAAKAAAAR